MMRRAWVTLMIQSPEKDMRLSEKRAKPALQKALMLWKTPSQAASPGSPSRM
ncbi:hypothetical protein D3C83_312090 [compost metagenome]